MSDNLKKKVWLIGTGPMAQEYAKVLKVQQIKFSAIGRGEASAKKFAEATGVQPFVGGVDCYLARNQPDEHTFIIIAVGTEGLMPILLLFKNKRFASILIEKPAAISIEELLHHQAELKPIQDFIFVAYNRRFYASVIEAQKMIEEDGGLQSMHFEFTEWAHKIEPLKKAPGVKENWFFANSTHVVDVAFYLAGKPTDWQAYSKPGELTWHPKTNFTGAGITDKGVLFSYMANWESAGRWGIELLTKKRRIYLKPMEEVQVQEKGSIAILPYDINDTLDKEFKPGIYYQIEEFLYNKNNRLPTLKYHIANSQSIFKEIVDFNNLK